MRKWLVVCVWCLTAVTVLGQDIAGLSAKFPGENALYLKRKQESSVVFIGNDIKINTDYYDEMLLLNEKGMIFNERSVGFSHFEEIRDLQAKTLVPEGKGYKAIKVSDFKTKSDVSSGVFYDDYKTISWSFPNLVPGAKTIHSYTQVLKEPRFFGSFFFGSYIPCVESEFVVRVPAGVKITYKLFGITEDKLQFTKKEDKKETVYRWKVVNQDKYRSDDGAPNIRYYAPHMIIYINEYTVNGNTYEVLSGPKSLYSWYYSLVKEVNKDPGEKLKRIVDSLVAGETDEFSKVKKIFYWVQDQVKYVAFEDGLGGFIPREAAQVCERRYGDCKDMANIITTMLTMANIKCHLTWIGTRDIPYTYENVPTPSVDNHMIATYIKDGRYYFLDATGKNAPIEIYTSMIQGKEALIGDGEGKFSIVRVPEVPKEMNKVCDTVFITLNNDLVRGMGSYECSGYEKIRLGERMQNMSDEDKVKYLKSYLQKGNNKFRADSIAYYNLKERSKDLEMKYLFSLPDYLKKNGDEMYLNLHLDKSGNNDFKDEEKRKVDVEFDFKSMETHTTILEIPEGYKATYLPPDASFEGEHFGFSIHYYKKGNFVYADKQINVNTLLLKTDQFSEWNKMIKLLSKAYTESIILKKG